MSGENGVLSSIGTPGATGGGLGGLLAASGGQAADPKMVAFQTQLKMAQAALNVGSLGDGGQPVTGLGADDSMLSDSMLMNALSTIARLTGVHLPQTSAAPRTPERTVVQQASAAPQEKGLGSVAALFESGAKGSAAIGYDRMGGTSYGTYQISSRAGTMGRFLNFLSGSEPAWAARLRASGPANTGSVHGRMPAEWARIANESPQRFEALQTEFIRRDHYQPAREKIRERTGVDIDAARPALREALFSTAVQHGAAGAARIFNAAIDKCLAGAGGNIGGKSLEEALVNAVYDRRQHVFGGSSAAVRSGVLGRLRHEKQVILSMLDGDSTSRAV